MRFTGLGLVTTMLGLALTSGAVADVQVTQTARVVAPAVYRSGPLPALPVMALGGGEVVVEVTVSARGAVVAVRPLRVTVPYTESVVAAVKTWQFTPAEELLDPLTRAPGEPPTRTIESKVTVAALFRPPNVYDNATLGEPFRDIDAPSGEAPFPISSVTPPFAPSARDGGVVLVEARVDESGEVEATAVKQSSPPFDEASLAAAQQWRFRPARVAGAPAAARVYLMFGFRVPDATRAFPSPPPR